MLVRYIIYRRGPRKCASEKDRGGLGINELDSYISSATGAGESGSRLSILCLEPNFNWLESTFIAESSANTEYLYLFGTHAQSALFQMSVFKTFKMDKETNLGGIMNEFRKAF